MREDFPPLPILRGFLRHKTRSLTRMKKTQKRNKSFNFHGEEDLFLRASFLLEEDLTNPEIEAEVRDLLAKFRREGHFFQGIATEEDGCLLGLYESLLEAVNSDPDDLDAIE